MGLVAYWDQGFNMSLLALLTELDAGEIVGIVTACCTGMVAIIGAIGKIVNDKRRERGHMKCCITGRKLKPKRKPKKPKS